MHITELTLQTHRLAAQRAFYEHTLELPVVEASAQAFTVQAGATRLTFQASEQKDVPYHVAFTIPRNTFFQAKGWLSQRAPLQRQDGKDEIFFSNLNARSFYFLDAADNILEFIVHYNLGQETEGDFGPADVLHVSEIGLPVEDVPAQAALLHEKLGIGPYGGSVSENFAFLGDIYGQLVVVKIGRPWLFSETVQAAPAPVQLTISGQREQQFQLAPHPYDVRVASSNRIYARNEG
jgi:catechol-2,3-dioxygenase